MIKMNAKEIVESYEDITLGTEVRDGVFFFTLLEKTFLFCAPNESILSSRASIYLYNDNCMDFPHIMLREVKIDNNQGLPSGIYRYVCLFEENSVINTLVSYEEKIIDCIDRLVELLSMTTVERIKEFQKEFLFYWNYAANNNIRYIVYLRQEKGFAELDSFYGNKLMRLIERDIMLADIDDRDKSERKWIQHIENDVYYIPITDTRDILPPHKGFKWSPEYVQSIVFGKRIEHISDDTYAHLKTIIPRAQNLIIVFGMNTGQSNITFALRVNCKYRKGHTLIEKLLSDITSVEPLYSERKDYLYLCEQIGNDIGMMGKSVLLIGAGSLGSYVAFELVKNGIQHLKIYDDDNLVEENVLRWAYGGIGIGSNKACTLKLLLNYLHPEINVEACSMRIDEDALISEVSDVDIIIFTIGSSDEQLKLNAILKKANCTIPVIFVWLEDGGEYSHILFVNYQTPGCFECLYTDKQGDLVNNRARRNTNLAMEKGLIHNGCGGTRAAYGTAILLRTTAALLDTLRDIQNQRIVENMLIDISSDRVGRSDTVFPMEACKCCGDSSK